ncbi:MAG: Cell division protein ftsA [Candidatus Woesebacteria bacterium GW2011_GWB1_43_14]|uniref:Cell division protein FtsA n=1 Tax=Candidatus Woesebacteria bacterium GW2011_GWB1_43_14 TaxID=1618578 RepID=A0A0G1DHV8_9BACT|nr:MAG: Cell division protein ftsA [Candidatus Woesebacteria bacterium GW2011_GWC1_42_9]KKS97142.1 MAG: Cell division protein ftsA [Candidatus Woesebacteria bacterium GW2011_GWB1_43_14]
MANKSRIVTAIDIGSSKIATLMAQVTQDPNSLEVSSSVIGVSSQESKGVKKGQIVDIEDAVETTIASVESAERMAGYSIGRAYVLVGGAHIASQNSTGIVAISDPDGEVSSDDVVRVIDAARAISLSATREVIHVLPREYIVDGESGVRDPVGMTGVRLEVDTHLVTASTAALKNLAKTVNEVGVDVEEMVFSGLAASWATLSSTEKELGCALIDIGAGTTSIGAFVDGALAYSGAIPIGARNVTNDLAIGLRVSLDTAEKIKISLGKKADGDAKREQYVEINESGGKEAKRISKRTLTEGIIRPRLSEIFNMVKLDLERAGIMNRIPSGLVVTGGGSLTVGLEDAAKRVMSLPVRVAKPSGVTGLVDDVLNPQFSAAVGLIKYAANVPDGGQGPSKSFGKKLKMPNTNILSGIIETIKDLLP